MTEPTIRCQPAPEHIAAAGAALAGVLAGDADVETRLSVGAALAILNDVHPPYPPPPSTEPEPLPTDDGIAAALDALARAAEDGTVEEAIRVGLAARELRQLQRDRTAHGSQP